MNQSNEFSHTRILVSGNFAAGKTSLIRAFCPENMAFPRNPLDVTLLYEAGDLDFIDARSWNGVESATQYLQAIAAEVGFTDQESFCCQWYCIDATTGRMADRELRFLSDLGRNTIPVLTKADCIEREKLDELLEQLKQYNLKQPPIIVSAETKSGLCRLMAVTLQLILEHLDAECRERIRQAYEEQLRPHLEEWRTRVEEQADSYINWAAGRAFAISVVPLPLADVGPLIANEVYMIYRLGCCYGIAVDKTILTGFLGCLGASIGGKFLASFIPFLKAPIAAAMTYAVGKAAKAYFESGMTVSAEALQAVFAEAESQAKKRQWN